LSPYPGESKPAGEHAEGTARVTLSLLFDGKFEKYFAEAATGTPLWLFVHIPKTAGSSLFTELSEFLRPAQNIHIDRTETARSYNARYDAAVDDFITQAKQRPFRFASGHIIEVHTARIRNALPDVRMITMLRQPVSRVVSDYRYQRTPMHPTHEEFKKKMPTLAHYVEQLGESNKMARHLVPKAIIASGDAQGCIDFVMQNYAFVGLQEMYPLCFQALTTLLGKPSAPTVKKRVNEVTDENPLFLTPELDRQIRSLNTLDMAIYEGFLKSYKAIRERLLEFVRARRIELSRPT
jgi:hypothetical protein